jgi:hypothetical protein
VSDKLSPHDQVIVDAIEDAICEGAREWDAHAVPETKKTAEKAYARIVGKWREMAAAMPDQKTGRRDVSFDDIVEALMTAGKPLSVMIMDGQVTKLHPLLQQAVRDGDAAVRKILRLLSTKPTRLQ